jgi:hypothetical protein
MQVTLLQKKGLIRKLSSTVNVGRNVFWRIQLNFTVKKKQRSKTNSVVLAHKRAILTERVPLVGEVSVNFSG